MLGAPGAVTQSPISRTAYGAVGQRYAIVLDPYGNLVDLFAPLTA